MSVNGQRWPRSPFAQIPAPGEGPAGGDLTGEFPNPVLVDVITPGTGTKVTVDSKGRVIVLDTLDDTDLPAHTHEIDDVTGLQSVLDDIDDALTALEDSIPTTQYLPITDGDLVAPQLIFSAGDIVVSEVPLP